MEVSIKRLKPIIKSYVLMKKPLFIHGTMGIGKSQMVREVGEEIAREKGKKFNENELDQEKFCLNDVRVSQLDPSDLRGIPFPEGKNTAWLIPKWLPSGGEGILLFDELNLSPPSIQAACYQLILDRKLGDYTLPQGWTIIAAGNRSSDGANVFPMAAPLKNRFSHVTLMCPTDEEWREWAMTHDIKSDIIAFLAFKPTLLHKFDKKSNDDAFPTPRTWEIASTMVKNIEKDTEKEFELVATCVGEGPALEYQGFLKLKEKVNIDQILNNPKKVRDIKEADIKYSLVSGLAERYRKDTLQKGDKEKKNLPQILEVGDNLDAEFGIFLLRLMKSMNPTKFIGEMMNHPIWVNKLFKKYRSEEHTSELQSH